MNKSEQKEKTQELLEKAYDLVATRLTEQMAGLAELGQKEIAVLEKIAHDLEIPNVDRNKFHLSQADSRRIGETTWRPVARTLVIYCMRQLFDAGHLDRGHESTSAFQELAKQTGISTNEVKLAMEITKNVLRESPLFAAPVQLQYRGTTFEVGRKRDILEAKKIHSRVAAKPETVLQAEAFYHKQLMVGLKH
jgi:hypothetical protein